MFYDFVIDIVYNLFNFYICNVIYLYLFDTIKKYIIIINIFY